MTQPALFSAPTGAPVKYKPTEYAYFDVTISGVEGAQRISVDAALEGTARYLAIVGEVGARFHRPARNIESIHKR